MVFSQVWAGAAATSNDIAYLTAAAGNTGFYGSDSATTGCYFGGSGYLNKILGPGFKTISVTAPAGSNTAYLTSTVATDRFYGYPTYSYIYDPGLFMMKVVGFSAVNAYATPGEYAYLLYGTGGQNTFNGTPTGSWLVSNSGTITVCGFYTVTAYGGVETRILLI